MNLSYTGKKSKHIILRKSPSSPLKVVSQNNSPNKLVLGENLSALATLMNTMTGMIDLVYIDPPYATNSDFKMSNRRANAVSASGTIVAYSDKMTGADYFEFIRERLILLRELLSDTGSIYVHVDYKVGHYIKVIMDEVFGPENFRNDITRIKCNPKNFSRKSYGNIKDLILFYSKSNKMKWNSPKVPYSPEDIEKLFKKSDRFGRRYTTTPLHAPGETSNGDTGKAWRGLAPPDGRHWRVSPDTLDEWDAAGLIEWSSTGNPRKKIYLDEKDGKKAQDIWEYKDPAYPNYPTQKNPDLLKLIISASSDESDLVLDCFCGSGTTLMAAEAMGRGWIGIDQSEPAIEVCHKNLLGVEYTYLCDENITSPQALSTGLHQRPLFLAKDTM